MKKEILARAAAQVRRAVAGVKKSRFAVVVFVIAARLVSAGFRSMPAGEDNPNDASQAASVHFWTAYHGNDYDAIPHVETELEAALQNDPDNPTLYALLGASHFWHIGEFARDANQQ